ncbi:protein of unknown function [Nitrospira japonica]|uniref:Uncharacterized protein n=1 Tax=Nitrospira japonica TaxID=1325564 RepID=A0A1W1I331_9BACT|nr:protein of unknown function [Nitrospira japonica]
MLHVVLESPFQLTYNRSRYKVTMPFTVHPFLRMPLCSPWTIKSKTLRASPWSGMSGRWTDDSLRFAASSWVGLLAHGAWTP